MSNLKSIHPSPQILNAVYGLDYAKTLTPDSNLAGVIDITLTGNLTLNGPVNPQDGNPISIRLIQDSVGGRTLTLGTGWKLPTSISTPTLSTAAGKCDVLTAVYRAATGTWNIISFLAGF